jgi:hypothetical protein
MSLANLTDGIMRTTRQSVLVSMTTGLLLMGAAYSASAAPLTVHAHNPRYFTDGSGKAIYLTGSHTWYTLQQTRFPGWEVYNSDFDVHLDMLQQYGHNFMRLWAWEDAYQSPLPYPRTGPGTANDGQPKFNLDQFDQAYFDRLRDLCIRAQQRGIYISVMLFQGWALDVPVDAEGYDPWPYHPFHPGNNIQAIDGGHQAFHTIFTAEQRRYVEKVIDTVNDLDNVMYEIGNEHGARTIGWQEEIVRYIHSYEASKAKRHPVVMSSGPGGQATAEVLASVADVATPGGMGYADHPPVSDGRRPLFIDTDHIWGEGGGGWWVWRAFTRGYHPLYMDGWPPLSRSYVVDAESARRAMRDTLIYAKRMNLASMSPRGDLTSSGYALANPGSEYLVYKPSGGAFTVSLGDGSYAVEWFDTSNGNVYRPGTIAGGNQSFTPPFSGDAVLYLKAGGVTPPPPAPSDGGPAPTPPPQPSSPPPSSVTISLNATTVAPGATMNVTVTGSTNGEDWIGIYRPNTDIEAVVVDTPCIGWTYLDGSCGSSAPSVATNPAHLTFTAPGSAGSYEYRVYGADTKILRARTTFTVGSASATPPPLPPSLPPTVTSSLAPLSPSGHIAATDSVTLTWQPIAGASSYAVRADDRAGNAVYDSRNNCGPHMLCVNGLTGTSITLSVEPGHSYDWWVHSLSGAGWSDGVYTSFTVGQGTPPPPSPGGYPTPTPPASQTTNKLKINDRVRVNAPNYVNVRSSPSLSGTIVGTQRSGALGTVIGGLTTGDGYTWWQINYDNAPDGWSAENFLDKVAVSSAVPPYGYPTPSPTPPQPPTASPPPSSAGVASRLNATTVALGATMNVTITEPQNRNDWIAQYRLNDPLWPPAERVVPCVDGRYLDGSCRGSNRSAVTNPAYLTVTAPSSAGNNEDRVQKWRACCTPRASYIYSKKVMLAQRLRRPTRPPLATPSASADFRDGDWEYTATTLV